MNEAREKGNAKQTVLKILNIVGNVLMYVVLVICLFSLIVAIGAKKDADGASTIFGYQFRIIQSDSMAKSEYTDTSDFDIKSLPLRTMVFIETVPTNEADSKEWYDELEEGDVLTFRYEYDRQVTITHRIVDIDENGEGGYIIKLEGDNKTGEHGGLTQEINTSDETSFNYVIGKVTGKSYLLGLLTSALKSKVGIVCIVIIPALFIIIAEVVKILGVLKEEKAEKKEQRLEEQQSEIEELKRQLAQLKGENVNLSEENAVKSDSNSTETTSSENKVNDITEV